MSDTDLFVIGKLVDLAVQVFAALIALKMWELYKKIARSLRLSPN